MSLNNDNSVEKVKQSKNMHQIQAKDHQLDLPVGGGVPLGMMNVDVGGGTIPRGDNSQGLMEFTPREGIIDNIDKSVENAETEPNYG